MTRRQFFAALLAPFSKAPQFQFGWAGFKAAVPDPVGTVIVGSNLIVPSPRTAFKLTGVRF